MLRYTLSILFAVSVTFGMIEVIPLNWYWTLLCFASEMTLCPFKKLAPQTWHRFARGQCYLNRPIGLFAIAPSIRQGSSEESAHHFNQPQDAYDEFVMPPNQTGGDGGQARAKPAELSYWSACRRIPASMFGFVCLFICGRVLHKSAATHVVQPYIFFLVWQLFMFI